MRFLPSFTLIGFDLFSFFRNKKSEPRNLFGGVSLLQSLKSFASGIGDQKEYTEEEELIEAGRLLAANLGEKEIISTVSGILPQNITQEIISAPFVPNASEKANKIPKVRTFWEFPKAFLIFSPQTKFSKFLTTSFLYSKLNYGYSGYSKFSSSSHF